MGNGAFVAIVLLLLLLIDLENTYFPKTKKLQIFVVMFLLQT